MNDVKCPQCGGPLEYEKLAGPQRPWLCRKCLVSDGAGVRCYFSPLEIRQAARIAELEARIAEFEDAFKISARIQKLEADLATARDAVRVLTPSPPEVF